MKFVVVESIVNSGRLLSLARYNETYQFQFQQVLNSSSINSSLWEKDVEAVCFDAFKVMNYFNLPILYDVKVLYELAGHKFRNLIDLAREELGEGRVLKYIGISDRVKAHIRSYKEAKIDYGQHNIEKLLPEDLVRDLYRERAMLLMELLRRFDNNEVLDFYRNRFYEIMKTLHDISREPIKIDSSSISESDGHFAKVVRKQGKEVCLKFNSVGAKTGRLAFKRGSLNIYNLPRSLRHCIVAPNDFQIVELDYKSFQPRLAIFSTEDEDFKSKFEEIDDIYSVFPGDREKNKISFLAWMFSLSRNEMFEKEASAIQEYRTKLFYQAKKSGRLINTSGRYIKHLCEEKPVVFQNYITSLEVDSVLNACVWVNKLLADKKSRVIFPFHDSIVCQIHKDEMSVIDEIKDYMETQSTGFKQRYPVEVKVGNNFAFED